MIVLDLLLGVFASALVTRILLEDEKRAKNQVDRAEELRRAAAALREPDLETRRLINEAFRRQAKDSPTVERLAEVVGSDPVWGERLLRWVLESDPDPEQRRKEQQALAQELAAESDSPADEVYAFLDGVYDGMHAHPEFSRLRADRKLDEVLHRLGDLEDLPILLSRHQLYIRAQLTEILSRERRRHIKPVCPNPRPWTEDNGLLRGNRPSDADMDEELDFRRTKFEEVIGAVRQVEHYPAAFAFRAFPQQGKTTFLKRVGWELAKSGYAVVQLEVASLREAYARWLLEVAAELDDRLLVVLIDDPHTGGEHFEHQMMTLSERGPKILCLIASRSSDWEQIDSRRASILRDARCFELEPDGLEGLEILKHIIGKGVVQIDQQHQQEVQAAVQRIPAGSGYFQKVIRLASDDRYKPTSVLVEERLKKAVGSPEAAAFEELYGFVCLFGMVGLSLREKVASDLVGTGTYRKAWKLADDFGSPPILLDKEELNSTHERYAEAFFEDRDWVNWLRQTLKMSIDQVSTRDPVGYLIEGLWRRGHGEQAKEVWVSLSHMFTEAYWESCSQDSLAGGWGPFLVDVRDHDTALLVYSRALDGYEGLIQPTEDNLDIESLIGKILLINSLLHGELGDFDSELTLLKSTIDRFGFRKELALEEVFATALVGQGKTYRQLGDELSAITSYQMVIDRFGSRDELVLEVVVAEALMLQAVTYGILGDRVSALTKLQTAVDRFCFREELEQELEEWTSKLFKVQDIMRSEFDDQPSSLSAYQSVIENFGSCDGLVLEEQLVKALLNQAWTHSELENWSSAISVYRSILDHFGSRDEQVLQKAANYALGQTVAILPRQLATLTLGSSEYLEAVSVAEAALVSYSSRTGKPLNQIYNYACLLALQGKTDEALSSLETCLEHDEISIDHVKTDTDWDNLRDHPKYQELIAGFEGLEN